jgi:CheY-like chemotaxis protein
MGNASGLLIMRNESLPLRVLIVDDDPLMSWSLAETLSACGDVVTEAATGEAAVRTLANEPAPNVVLLDYQLPDSGDLQLLSA